MLKNFLKSLFKKHRKQSIGVIGSTFAVTTFLFFVTQNAIKDMSSIITLSWIVSIIFCLLFFSIILLVYTFVMRHKYTVFAHSTEKNFVLAFIEYIKFLKEEGKDESVVVLRNNMSRTLYVLKYNKEMVQLGECTLKAAGIKKDHETKIEVLIDELGWCNYQLKKEKEAIKNVNKAVEFYGSFKDGGKEPSDRIKLAYYKGLRHLSIMNAKKNYSQSEGYLNEALKYLESLKERQQVQVDIAQVYNAKAQIIAINLDIYNNKNVLSNRDENGKEQVRKAVGFVKKASDIFEPLGEIDRHIKSVELHHRLSESIGDKMACSELQGIKEDLEKKSPWVIRKIKT